MASMGKKKMTRDWDVVQVFRNIPDLLRMDLKLRGSAWEGRYYINGERHAYKKDKLKVKVWDGDIWIHEQGGPSMSLATWLINFGGCPDYKSAYSTIRGMDTGSLDFTRQWVGEVSGAAGFGKVRHVDMSEYAEYRKFDLWGCPLFRWLSGLFGLESVTSACDLYGVTTDERGLAVWWFVDPDGEICHDKRMRYREDGHRDKTFGGTRKYKTSDGYTDRPLFGAHLVNREMPHKGILSHSDGILSVNMRESIPNVFKSLETQKINIVESEKTALMCQMAFGGLWLATGGKTNLRESDMEVVLWPDIDAATEWSERGDVCEWWIDAESVGMDVGEHSDMGDFVEYMISYKNR